MSNIYLTQKQRFILQQAQMFYLGSGSFHFAKAISNILMSGRFKDTKQFYSCKAAISSIVSPHLVNAFFNLSI